MISPELARYVTLQTIPVRYAAEMLRRPALPADRVRALLAEAALPEEMLEVPQFRLSVVQFARLYEVARRATGDELFGFFRRAVPIGAYATLIALLTRCSTIEDAFDATKTFYRMFDPHDHWRLESTERKEVAKLRLSTADEAQAESIFFVHTSLLSMWRTLLWLADQRIALRGMILDRRFASMIAETRFLFGVEPTFAGENAILFDAHVLELAVVRRPSDAQAYAATSLLQMLGEAPQDSLESQIRALLSAERPIASSGLKEIAEALNMSRQTLSRRLQERGSSFQTLKDDLRRDHAIAMLTGSNRSVADIGEALGYSEPSAFSRAFRAWTGLSPGRYRGEHG
jgi:AraC-like DNA-binding protein